MKKIDFKIKIKNFYLQRYRKHSRINLNANRPITPNELLQNFPNLRKVKPLGKNNISILLIKYYYI